MPARLGRFVWHVAMALASIAAVTILCYRIIPVNATTAGFAYLLVVLGISAAWELPAAATAAVGATLCFNFYFLPPIGQFSIGDPQNWVALLAFLATALIASQLSDRAKKQALEAQHHQLETERLYALSRIILLTDSSRPMGSSVTQHIAEIFDCRSVALYDTASGEIFRGGQEDLPGIEAELKRMAIEGGREDNGTLIAAILLGGRAIGSLALRGMSLSDGAVQALLNLVAIALERVRMEEAANRAAAARQSEEFKSTLLDAIAHEFKTPLTSIKAASTSLASEKALSAQSRELATIIDEEADRMCLLVTEAVRMSHIDAGKVRVERRQVDIAGLLEDLARQFEPRTQGRSLSWRAASSLPSVSIDPDLVSLALRQLIDNALKYSPPDSPVDIGAALENARIVLRVHDQGLGIPERERERIFDKFYRRTETKTRMPGTGLGLYIAREVIRIHGGDVWVEGTPQTGCEFCASLPVPEKEART